MRILKYLCLSAALFCITGIHFNVLAEDIKGESSERVGLVSAKEIPLYAIIKIDGAGKKLYAEGDIFFVRDGIDEYCRIYDIQKDTLVLKNVNSGNVFEINAGETIPVGIGMVFEKTLEAGVVEYRYTDTDKPRKRNEKDFTVKTLENGKVVLEKKYNSKKLHGACPSGKENPESGMIGADLLENIDIKKTGNDEWAVEGKTLKPVFMDAGKSLFSMIKGIDPRYKSGNVSKLKFNCGTGDVVLNKDGFFVQGLAEAELLGRAGIKQGDPIKSINGYPVNSLYGIYRAYMNLRENSRNKEVKLDIVRDSKHRELVYKIR
jgi:hypothetical protein